MVWLHSFLFPTLDGGKSSASGTSRFTPGDKSARSPINRRLSGQKCRYGSLEKKILVFTRI